MMSGKPAIFVDRDGTLNELVGYLNDLDAFELYPWSHEAIRLINGSGFLAVVVTNQSGVARGILFRRARSDRALPNDGNAGRGRCSSGWDLLLPSRHVRRLRMSQTETGYARRGSAGF